MRRLLALAALLVTVSCGTTVEPEPVIAASRNPVVATDPRVGELETTVRELTDRLEVMQARLEAMEDVVQAYRSVRETPSATAANDMERTVERQVAVANAGELYREAQIMFGRGEIEKSRTTFEQVFRADPVGDLADNALFWIGETYFVMAEYRSAIRVFDKVVTDFGNQNKAPDALLRKGQALARLGDLAFARQVFQDLIARYPATPAASAAEGELVRIRY